MTVTVQTEHSIYEVDQEKRLTRRLSSDHAATPNQGQDTMWKPYTRLTLDGLRLLFEWGTDAEGIQRRTLTSNVLTYIGGGLDLPDEQP